MPRATVTTVPIISQRREDSPYVRGDYWLGTVTHSPNFYIFRYDQNGGRIKSWTARSSNLIESIRALDERWLTANDQSPSYCPTCGQKRADGTVYSIIQAISDYKIEHGCKMSSYEAIRARLNHVIRFVLERFSEDHPCSAATTDEFVNEFRAWLTPQPVSWTNNAGQITVQHVRTISSVEDSIHQLRAVLNFAVKKQRSDAKPLFTTKTRSVVSKPIRTRASLDQLAAMVAYAAEPDKRREGLLRFLVASICTAARPDTLFDMSIDPERCQYDSVQNTFDLNPHGRTQTKKYRPVVPVLPPLKYLIETTTSEWVIHYYGRRVRDVRSSWRTMISDLGYEGGRGWGAYVMRRSMSKLLRESGALAWDVQGLLGHRTAGTTEVYTDGVIFPTATANLLNIIANIEDKAGYCLSTFTPKSHLS